MKAAKRFKTQEREKEREKSSWQGEKTEEKEQQQKKNKQKKKCFEEEIVDVSFESNINTVVEKHLIRNYTC